MESKSNKNTPYDLNESSQNQGWNWHHPNIQPSFYEKIPAPTDCDDARIKMNCHEHAIKDFDLQLEMNVLQMDMLMEEGKVLDYHMADFEDLEQKKLKLLIGKRFHQNACNAYWYWTQREKSGK